MEILVFGDSIAYGAWDERGGWVQRLKERLDATMRADPSIDNLLYNLSFSGGNTEMLAARADFEIRHRRIEGERMAIIFAIGINDSVFFTGEKRNAVPLGRFAGNIRRLSATARKYSRDVAFVGLTPVDESRTSPVPWVESMNYLNEHVARYDAEIRKACGEDGVPFIDVLGPFRASDYRSLLDDGVHPNERGHERICEMVWAHLDRMKIMD
jgi:lysophospholipase L1-like esterase